MADVRGDDRDGDRVLDTAATIASEKPLPSEYDVTLARITEEHEKSMTWQEAVTAEARTILYCIGISGLIIMEGYGLAMITYLYSFQTFRQTFGVKYTTTDGSEFWRLSWLTSFLPPTTGLIGSFVGTSIAPALTTRLGYRWTTLLMLGVAALCVAGETFARKGLFSILVAAIFCHGIPWGVFQVVSASYISEVSPVKLRGMLTTWINLCWVVGQFLAAIVAFALLRVDSEYGWKGAYSIQWLFIVVLATVVGFSPESPYWYLQRKRFAEAERTLKRFARKGDPVWAKAKMALMCHTLQQEEHDGDGVANTPSKFQPLKSFFNAACYRGTNRRRTSIACMTWVIQSCCGSAIIGWAPVFFQSAGLRSDKALAFNMAIPGVGVIGTLASWGLMLRWGRRRIFLAGLLVQAIVLGICGGFGFLPQRVGGWAAGGTIVAFTLVYDLSIGPIAYSIAAEVPSIVLRSQTLSIARSCYLLTGIVNHVLTPKLLDSMSWNLGAKTAFIFAAINLLGFVYTWFSIPEIKDIDARQMDVLFQAQVSARGFSSEKAAELD